MPECAKTHLQQSRISKFSGGGAPDPLFKGRGGEGREGKGKGRWEGKDREGKEGGEEWGEEGMGGEGHSTWAPPPRDKLWIRPLRRAAATVCPPPRPSSPPWAPKRLAPPRRRQRSSSFPRPTRSHAHHCSRLTRQHGGEQSGLVTLTFDLESGVRVTCDVGYPGANFGLPRSLCS